MGCAIPTLLWLFLLCYKIICQSSLMQVVPSHFQASRLTLIITHTSFDAQKDTAISFDSKFPSSPLVVLALTEIATVSGSAQVLQRVKQVGGTGFIHGLAIEDLASAITTVRICYMALLRSKFPFFSAHQLPFTYDSSLSSEFKRVDYLTPLTPDTVYTLGAFLTGFDVQGPAGPALAHLGIQVQLYSDQAYLMGVRCEGLLLKQVQVTRYLINQNSLQAQSGTGLGELTLKHGQVQHFEEYRTKIEPERVVFYHSAFFVGVMQFDSASFDVFDNPSSSPFRKPQHNPRIRVGFLVFMELVCDPSEPGYIPSPQACTASCALRLYQLSKPGQCGKCHLSCYTCSGPQEMQCTECMGDRNFVGQVCSCPAGYIEAPVTLDCVKCSDPLNCHTTIRGRCTGDNEYTSPHTNKCECLPQFFKADSCLACAEGCYICQGAADNCSECVDTYHLVGHRCIFFYKSNLIGAAESGLLEPGERCLAKMADECFAACPATSKLYQGKCYAPSAFCPPSTCAIKLPSQNQTCHPCPFPCIECTVYYQCRKCDDRRGYFKTGTGLCRKCSPGCLFCLNENTCHSCDQGLHLTASGGCAENLTQISIKEICPVGCADCTIEEYCEKCESNYFLVSRSHSCFPCSLPTLRRSQEPAGACEELCGDGIVINQQCDDGNTADGDGCSSSCQSEAGFSCSYLPIDSSSVQFASVCLRGNYSIKFRTDYILNSTNLIQLSALGEGIGLSSDILVVKCWRHSQRQEPVDFSVESASDAGPQSVTFRIRIEQDFQNVYCSLRGQDSSEAVKGGSFLAVSAPAAFVRQGHNEDIVQIIHSLLKHLHKPLAFLVWIFCVLGADPFDVWLNTSFIVLLATGLHSKSLYPPSVYSVFDYLRFFVFDTAGQPTPETYLQSTLHLLLLMGVVLVWHEVIVRALRTQSVLPAVSQLFACAFKNRFILYVAVITAFEPALVFNSLKFSFLAPSLVPLLVLITITFLILVSFILLLLQAQRMAERRSMRKFVFLFLNAKWLGLFTAIGSHLQTSEISTLALNMTLLSLFTGGIICVFDTYDQEMVDQVSSKDSEKQPFSLYAEKALQGQTQRKDQKRVLRKCNLVLQFGCHLSVTVLSMCYFADGSYSNCSQALGSAMLCIIVLGQLFSCTALGLASQGFTLAIYAAKSAPKAPYRASVHPLDPPIPEESFDHILDPPIDK